LALPLPGPAPEPAYRRRALCYRPSHTSAELHAMVSLVRLWNPPNRRAWTARVPLLRGRRSQPDDKAEGGPHTSKSERAPAGLAQPDHEQRDDSGFRLDDRVTFSAAQLRPYMSDDFEPRRHILERFGNIFTQLAQGAPASRTSLLWRLVHHHFRWKMFWQWAPCRLACRSGKHCSYRGSKRLFTLFTRFDWPLSRSSSCSSSCSISRWIFSDLRPHCIRRKLLMISRRRSIEFRQPSIQI
jgi:ubiquitin